MTSVKANVPTVHASKYLQQLCKHFAHKLPVTFDPERGRIEFSLGVCELTAVPGVLNMRAEAADETALRQLEQVVARHLERFAFREQPEIAWIPAVAA